MESLRPYAHVQEDLQEQEALERLATLSVLARMVDLCVVSPEAFE